MYSARPCIVRTRFFDEKNEKKVGTIHGQIRYFNCTYSTFYVNKRLYLHLGRYRTSTRIGTPVLSPLVRAIP